MIGTTNDRRITNILELKVTLLGIAVVLCTILINPNVSAAVLSVEGQDPNGFMAQDK